VWKVFVRKRDDESWIDKRFSDEKKKFGGGLNIIVWGMISNEGQECI